MSDDQHDKVVLRDAGGTLEVTFVPTAGMLCCSLRHRGEELLAQNAGVAAYAARGKTMGIPLLYPWANRLAAFDYTVASRTVAVPHDTDLVALDPNGLPIHGVIGGRIAWELAHLPGDAVHSLTARLSWSDALAEVFDVFPFRHDLAYRALLEGGRLTISVTVTACGADIVPVAFGFHPYLSLAGIPREQWLVELPALRHLELDAKQIPRGVGEQRPATRFELAKQDFDDGFDSVPEPARFAVSAAGRSITLEFSEGYPYAQLYAPPAGQFICFEPMTAPTNTLRSGVGLRLLAPGESHRASFSVSVVDSV